MTENNSQTSSSKEEIGEETQTDEISEEETKISKSESSKGEIKELKEKFANSFKEVERYRKEIIPSYESRLREEQEKREVIEKEYKDWVKNLEDDDPDKSRLWKMEKTVQELKQETLLNKEKTEIAAFLQLVPKAEPFKEALQGLGRAYPTKSYSELWTEMLESNLGKEITQLETGKGSRTKEPSGGTEIDLKEFGKLPLAKQKQVLKKTLREEKF